MLKYYGRRIVGHYNYIVLAAISSILYIELVNKISISYFRLIQLDIFQSKFRFTPLEVFLSIFFLSIINMQLSKLLQQQREKELAHVRLH